MGKQRRESGQLVLLLRGINLAARHRVSMAELRAALETIGYANPRTHLQSGNVVLSDASESPDAVAHRVTAHLSKHFGFAIPVLARTAEELADVVAADPLGQVARDPARYVVTFLNSSPDESAVRSLLEQDFGAEQFVVRGREVYQWCPDGQHRSPLVEALSKAGVTSTGTARNWRTVSRLAEMASG